jgi:ACS family hexuronate transporter-like MFS transporter
MSDASQSSRLGAFRWTICGLLLTATMINYMDRQILGLLKPQLQHDIGWSEVQYARIVIAFQAAYALGLAGFGRLIDKWGTKLSYGVAMVGWSLAAAGHALVSTVMGFGIMRFLLGVGEAGNFPAAVKAVAEWFPKKERALATGIFNSGSNIGAVIAPAVIPLLAVTIGWRGAFVLVGALGLLWLPFWLLFYSAPGQSRRLSAEELAHIRQDGPEESRTPVAWGALLRHRQAWAFMVGKFLTDPIWWFYLFWLPGWLNKTYAIDLKRLGPPVVVVYVMATVGSILGGYLSSRLLGRGATPNRARKTALLICACGVVPVLLVVKASGVWVAVLLVGLAAASHQGWSANLFTTVSDMFPKRAVASVTGLGGMAGSIGAILFSEVVGQVLERTGAYWVLFAIGGFAYLLALGIMHLLVPRMTPVDLDRSQESPC